MTKSDAAQRIVGYIAALAFIFLAWQSMSAEYELTWPVIIGVVIIVAMLLGKVNEIARLVDTWRNG